MATSKSTQKRIATLRGEEPEQSKAPLDPPVTVAADPMSAPQETARTTPPGNPLLDPGPPPRMPLPPEGSWPFPFNRMGQLADAGDRQGLQEMSTLNMGPAVAHYKAELLSWVDAMERYEGTKQ